MKAIKTFRKISKSRKEADFFQEPPEEKLARKDSEGAAAAAASASAVTTTTAAWTQVTPAVAAARPQALPAFIATEDKEKEDGEEEDAKPSQEHHHHHHRPRGHSSHPEGAKIQEMDREDPQKDQGGDTNAESVRRGDVSGTAGDRVASSPEYEAGERGGAAKAEDGDGGARDIARFDPDDQVRGSSSDGDGDGDSAREGEERDVASDASRGPNDHDDDAQGQSCLGESKYNTADAAAFPTTPATIASAAAAATNATPSRSVRSVASSTGSRGFSTGYGGGVAISPSNSMSSIGSFANIGSTGSPSGGVGGRLVSQASSSFFVGDRGFDFAESPTRGYPGGSDEGRVSAAAVEVEVEKVTEDAPEQIHEQERTREQEPPLGGLEVVEEREILGEAERNRRLGGREVPLHRSTSSKIWPTHPRVSSAFPLATTTTSTKPKPTHKSAEPAPTPKKPTESTILSGGTVANLERVDSSADRGAGSSGETGTARAKDEPPSLRTAAPDVAAIVKAAERGWASRGGGVEDGDSSTAGIAAKKSDYLARSKAFPEVEVTLTEEEVAGTEGSTTRTGGQSPLHNERKAVDERQDEKEEHEESKGDVVTAVEDAGIPLPRRLYSDTVQGRREGEDDAEEKAGNFSLPPEIDTIRAAIESGVPEAVSAVLQRIPHTQAVAELTARHGRKGSTTNSLNGTESIHIKDNEGCEETLIMLAALSGNLEMFHTVLRIMRQKTPTEGQIAAVLEAKDADGRSLVTSAAEGGSLAVFEEAVELMGGQLAVVSEMSAREAGYLLRMAARSGSVEIFGTIRSMLARDKMMAPAVGMATQTGPEEDSILVEAASTGNADLVQTVVAAMVEELTEESFVDKLAACEGPRHTTILMAAAESKSPAAVAAVLAIISTISDGGGIEDLMDDENLNNSNKSQEDIDEEDQLRRPTDISSDSSKASVPVMVMAMSRALSLGSWQKKGARNSYHKGPRVPGWSTLMMKHMIMARNSGGFTALSCAANSAVLENVQAISGAMVKFLPNSQMNDAYSSAFALCCANLPAQVEDNSLDVLAYLLQHGAKPRKQGLIRLCNSVKFARLKECLLGAVSSADNPFIPGMNLSVSCTVATKRALEGEKRRLTSMQGAVDELLLEVLEHMPQTVMGFKGEMKDCSAVFEPETVLPSHRGCQGPLSVALQKRQQMETYCTIPLVLDYMSRKFSRGLPNLKDTEGVLLNNKGLTQPGQTLYGDGLLAEGKVLFLGMVLQRGYGGGKLSSITYFPGARFIIAGLLARPDSYYKVPSLRMALDLVIYLAMMVIFSTYVILHESGSSYNAMDTIFTFYIFGGILTEIREVYQDPWEYLRDQWNVLDLSSLFLFLSAAIFRFFEGVEDHSAKACYALGAPLAFARILFYAQILPSQGPMIQVVFSMTGLLAKFVLLMLVIMLGFVTSFYSLYRQRDSYGEIWKAIFIAMLGETEYFDIFSGTPYDAVATLLFVMYLVVMSIMMLNLLVAVLSTAHARVDADADLEYKVTKARLIKQYVNVVESDRVPSPFNLAQWLFTLPFLVLDYCCVSYRGLYPSSSPDAPASMQHSSTSAGSSSDFGDASSNSRSYSLSKVSRGFFGRLVFWAMLGPIAVVAGWLLWAVSILKAPYVVWHASRDKTMCGRVVRTLMAILACAVGAPLLLLVTWFRGGLLGLKKTIGSIGEVFRCRGHRERRRKDGGGRTKRGNEQQASEMGMLGGGEMTIASPVVAGGGGSGSGGAAVGDANERVVKDVLEEADGALAVSELQLFLDDPMSDPDVRRDEETRATTVEHIKLLRNRLEATSKEHIDKLQAYFVKTASEISRQVDRAVMSDGGRDGDARFSRIDGGNSFASTVAVAEEEDEEEEAARGVGDFSLVRRRDQQQQGRGRLESEGLRRAIDIRFSELDRRLEERASALEATMVAMLDKRLGAMTTKLDAVLNASGTAAGEKRESMRPDKYA